ncbi:ROK family transcriptional regulator [Actinoplanes sp. NEAU-A12]|uniref:ROK family transcriptional regulator n=1 Tax=Actinoplanes sandaracinus TaxID=3045177 RepID=A0ABT6WHX7_9ACTN|nr:ROK family transcriptional regulator [Actinoplanes sandaracinus]MDI6099316.1 ROK family transcriptional regulator [Actinoplanes sandaracinus]
MGQVAGEASPASRRRGPGARESILDAIRAAGRLSRVELAAITGLTEAAVSMTVRRLLEEGLVVETGRTPTGGKPRTLLRLDPAARLAVGVYLDRDTTTYVLTGQTGGVISRLARPAPTGDLLSHLAADIDVLLAGSGVDRARCLGVGLVWPGPRSGVARLDDTPPHLRGWDGEQLGRDLAAAAGWPVLVENNATAAAVGEYWVARVGPERAFAALYMGSGIGAGIIVDGRAMRGGHGGAGEFGHVCVLVDGPECWCGSRGCLEALAGPRAVVAAALADPAAAAEAGLDPGAARRGAATDFAAIARAARAGAPRCLALLEDSARYVAAAAESVVNLLDIDLVVLTGPGFAAASFVYGPAIMRRVGVADARTWRRSVTVTVSLAAATASATGAAALVLQSHLRR